jgi:hypothetical protein
MMETPQAMKLELGKHRIPLEIERVQTVRSRHTGQELLEVHGVSLTADPGMHEWLSRTLPEVAGRTVRSVEPFDNRVRKWRVSWNSYAESAGEHRYTLILREEEELSLQELVLDGVRLHPYEYREIFSGDELTIWAKLIGTKAEVLRLRALLKTRDCFPVIRRGIRDEPRLMRFGVAEWSLHDERIKFRVVLVDDNTDLAEHPELARIEEANNRAAISFYMNFVEHLARALETRGILPAEEIEAARAAARDELWPARHEFWRVPDVDLL